jgi:4-hydroxybenzoate polyprenyltransferase
MIRSLARDCIRLYRVTDWLHFLPLPLAGWYGSQERSWAALAGGLIAWALSLAYMSAINQAFDDRLDRGTLGKNPVGPRFTRSQAVCLAIAPALGIFPALLWLSPRGLVPALVVLFAATAYSAPPRLKRVPVLGTLWNIAVGVPGLFFAGSPDFDRVPFRLFVTLFAALLLVSQLIHEAEDRDDDRTGGVTTIAVLAGTRGALSVAVLLLLCIPPLTWCLARGINMRGVVTTAVALFSSVWSATLISRIARADLAGLRSVRLNYRYAALALGTGVFAAITFA